MCLGNIQKKLFFSFSYVVEYFMHKGNNRIPKKEQLACLAFVVVLPYYLLNRNLCGGKDFLNTHTQYIWGDAQVGAGSAEMQRGGDTGLQQQLLLPALGALTPVLKQSLSMTK